MKLISKGFSLLLSSLTLIGLSPLTEGKAQVQSIPEEAGTMIIAQRQMPTLPINKLPSEAQITINLINQGGPFPYKQDGSIFRNREKRLPSAPVGYYREYTVPTPGSSDRGARRIITGQGNEIYYTGDHYRSFVRVQ
jgi:ribonuclease T1